MENIKYVRKSDKALLEKSIEEEMKPKIEM